MRLLWEVAYLVFAALSGSGDPLGGNLRPLPLKAARFPRWRERVRAVSLVDPEGAKCGHGAFARWAGPVAGLGAGVPGQHERHRAPAKARESQIGFGVRPQRIFKGRPGRYLFARGMFTKLRNDGDHRPENLSRAMRMAVVGGDRTRWTKAPGSAPANCKDGSTKADSLGLLSRQYGQSWPDIAYQDAFNAETAGYEMSLILNVPTFAICCASLLDTGKRGAETTTHFGRTPE